IERYAAEDAAFVRSKQVKLIVIACNTASALAAASVRRDSPVPVLGVIGPGAKRAVELSRSLKIGVIATEATIGSRAYESRILEMSGDSEVFSRACPLFVPLAEEGWVDHAVTLQVAEEYLHELRSIPVDTLVLGCTHYPILRPVIEQVMGDSVNYVDSGEAVASEVARVLETAGLARGHGDGRTEEFYVTDSPDRFRRVAERFLGRRIEMVETVRLGE
ncbi:MAG TPA: glutamate racemase, partial [Blastocatellia bacterium]|nr:glutamate racemase [Blastocatellia bacterium]